MIEVPDEKELLEEELVAEALESEEFLDEEPGSEEHISEEPDEVEGRGRRFVLKFISVIIFLTVLVGAFSIGAITSFSSLLTSEEEIMISWEKIQTHQAVRRDLLADLLVETGHEAVPVDLLTGWRRAQSTVDEGASFSDEIAAQPAADRAFRRVISATREAAGRDESGRADAILEMLDDVLRRIGAERLFFNEKVAEYRNYLKRIPTRWVARALRFKEIPDYGMNRQ